MRKIIFAHCFTIYPTNEKCLKLTLSELIQKKNIWLLGSQVVVIRGEEIMIPGYLNACKYPDSRDIPNIYILLLLLTNIPFCLIAAMDFAAGF